MPAASAKVLAAGLITLLAIVGFLIIDPGSGGDTRLESAPDVTAAPAEEDSASDESKGSSGPALSVITPDDGSGDGSGDGATAEAGSEEANGEAQASSARAEDQSAPSDTPSEADPSAPPSTEAFESIRNRQDKFSRFGSIPTVDLDMAALTEPAPRPDNGSSPEGQFRVACEYSHFGNDDPIVFPGSPGASHLHMFFGNTLTNAHTTDDSLLNTGGGTCSGFELNRSGYWTPALLDGKGNTVVPYSIILYYKTKFPGAVSAMPQGLQMLAGNFEAESFSASHRLHWSCGGSGAAYNLSDRIPECGGDFINATIQFPSCWDGVNLGSDDFVSHLDFGDDNAPCPASHPVRLPRISILLYYSGVESVDGWHLSSDNTNGFNGPPGGTLHADWWGAWNDDAMNLWINGCMKASRNCSFGQTGTSVQLAGLSNRDVYEGPTILPLP